MITFTAFTVPCKAVLGFLDAVYIWTDANRNVAIRTHERIYNIVFISKNIAFNIIEID